MTGAFDSVYERIISEARSSDDDNCYCFDVDGTVFNTDAKVRVLDPITRTVVAELTPSEYNDFNDKPENSKWKLDFSDFDRFDDSSNPKPILYTMKILRSIHDRSRKKQIYVITARRSVIRGGLLRKFSEYGVVIKPENVFCVGDAIVRNPDSDIATEKAKVLRMLRRRHSGTMEFYDDDELNCEIARKINVNGKKIKVRKINGYLR